jgi:trk system potassium uptake protein TrkH
MTAAPIPRATRRLQAARLVGASVIAVLAERVVTGTSDSASFLGVGVGLGVSIGSLYSLVIAAITGACAVGILGGQRWASIGFPLLLTLHIGVFVPVLAIDAPTATGVILWCLMLLGDSLFALSLRNPRVRRGEPRASTASMGAVPAVGADTGPWISRYGDAMRHLVIVAVLATTAVGGFRLTGSVTAHAICVLLDLAVCVATAPFVLLALRQRRRYLVALVVVLALGLPPALTSVTALLGLFDVYLAGVLALMLARSQVIVDLLQSFYTRPALLILSTFGLLAGVGALLLTFPGASNGGQGVPFIDALFTSMSATCVTGLIVLDTPNAFSTLRARHNLDPDPAGRARDHGAVDVRHGDARRAPGLRGEQALEEMLDLTSPGSAYELTRFIVLSTLLIEAVGARDADPRVPLHVRVRAGCEALWRGTFHAISAFCNAGFSLWSDSLIQFQSRHVRDVRSRGADRARRARVHGAGGAVAGCAAAAAAAVAADQGRALYVGGADRRRDAAVRGDRVEHDAGRAGHGDKWLNALFQSVTLRTAGFNSVDYAALERSTILMMIVWMFIGASPGSTGGGIKTTTLAVMLAAIPALLRNQPRALLLRRTIPHDIVYRAATIMTVATMVAVVVTFLLLATHDMPLEKLAFRGGQRAGHGRAVDRGDRRVERGGQVDDHRDDVHRSRRSHLDRAGARDPAHQPHLVPRSQGDGRVMPGGPHER